MSVVFAVILSFKIVQYVICHTRGDSAFIIEEKENEIPHHLFHCRAHPRLSCSTNSFFAFRSTTHTFLTQPPSTQNCKKLTCHMLF